MAGPVNILPDPGFEGSLVSWESSDPTIATVSASTTITFGGAQSLQMDYFGTGQAAAQSLVGGLVVGRLYRIQAWFFCPLGSGDLIPTIRIDWPDEWIVAPDVWSNHPEVWATYGGPTVASTAPIPEGVWTLRELVFTALYETVVVQLLNFVTGSVGQSFNVDDMAVSFNVPKVASVYCELAGEWTTVPVMNIIGQDFGQGMRSYSEVVTFEPDRVTPITPLSYTGIMADYISYTDIMSNASSVTKVTRIDADGASQVLQYSTPLPIEHGGFRLIDIEAPLDTTFHYEVTLDSGMSSDTVIPPQLDGTNILRFPSSTLGFSPYQSVADGAVIVSGGGYQNRQVVRCESTGTTTRCGLRTLLDVNLVAGDIPAGSTVMFSVDVFLPSSYPTTDNRIQCIMRDDASNDSAAATFINNATPTVNRDEWVRLVFQANVNPGRSITGIYVTPLVSAASPIAAGLYFDTARWRASVNVIGGDTDYFDGDTTPYDVYTYRWSGTAGESSSERLKARAVIYGNDLVMRTDECSIPTTSIAPDTALHCVPALLSDPLSGTLSMWVGLLSIDALSHSGRRELFEVISKHYPISISDVRSTPRTQIRVATATLAERSKLLEILGTGRVLLLRIPDESYPEAYWYISVGDLSEERIIRDHRRPERRWVLEVAVVERPYGLVTFDSNRDYNEVMNFEPDGVTTITPQSYQGAILDYSDYLAMLTGTSPAAPATISATRSGSDFWPASASTWVLS